jgi:hypothetical protein
MVWVPEAPVIDTVEGVNTDVFCSLHATELDTTDCTPSDIVHFNVPLLVVPPFTVLLMAVDDDVGVVAVPVPTELVTDHAYVYTPEPPVTTTDVLLVVPDPLG